MLKFCGPLVLYAGSSAKHFTHLAELAQVYTAKLNPISAESDFLAHGRLDGEGEGQMASGKVNGSGSRA